MKIVEHEELLKIYSYKTDIQREVDRMKKELESPNVVNKAILKELIKYKEIQIGIFEDFINIHRR